MLSIMANRKQLDFDTCWEAIQKRDDHLVGLFFFAVITTGIFCRPSCPARRPKRENLQFFPTVEEAKRAGFRPCKRCKPEEDDQNTREAELIARLCRKIRTSEEMPSLGRLAEIAGLSSFHLHRVFKKHTGITPKAFMTQIKNDRMRGLLGEAGSVTEAIFAAGYSSSSRFYEQSDEVLGMEPKQYRSGGRNVQMTYAVETCWLGHVLIALTEKGVCAILFGEEKQELTEDLRRRFSQADISPASYDDTARMRQVLDALAEPHKASVLPLDIIGTAFQQRIWTALRTIKPGETASYSEIAERIGAPKAARAVAGACAANPLAIAVPCHRVVRSDGALSGYRWGVERKKQLLEKEGAIGKKQSS